MCSLSFDPRQLNQLSQFLVPGDDFFPSLLTNFLLCSGDAFKLSLLPLPAPTDDEKDGGKETRDIVPAVFARERS